MRAMAGWKLLMLATTTGIFWTLSGSAYGAACSEDVLIGQPLAEVAAKCPQPTLKEHRDLWEDRIEDKKRTRSTTSYEAWIFDTGPQEFLLNLVFVNAKLAEIRNLGYGSMRDPMMPECRNGEGLALGDAMVAAYLKCGEPLAREKRGDKVEVTVEGEVTRRTSIALEEWTYRYGPELPGYTVRFENGVAKEIRPREFGK